MSNKIYLHRTFNPYLLRLDVIIEEVQRQDNHYRLLEVITVNAFENVAIFEKEEEVN